MDLNPIPPVKKPRLEWLDALRGFTMILVVAYHVCQQGFMVYAFPRLVPHATVLLRQWFSGLQD